MRERERERERERADLHQFLSLLLFTSVLLVPLNQKSRKRPNIALNEGGAKKGIRDVRLSGWVSSRTPRFGVPVCCDVIEGKMAIRPAHSLPSVVHAKRFCLSHRPIPAHPLEVCAQALDGRPQ